MEDMVNENAATVNVLNDYAIAGGENLPNHSMSLKGHGRFVRQCVPELPIFRTKQDAYRYAAWLVETAKEFLPDIPGCEGHTFDVIQAEIQELDKLSD